MLPESSHHDVIIVGAGPSGLMMAAQLLRHGVQPLIIDSKQGPTNQSKALAVQARSMEIYRQLGVVKKIEEGGKHAPGLNFHQGGKIAASLPLTDVGTGQTPFPYVNLYQQSKNERLLLDYLTVNCCPVYWNSTITELRHQTNQVDVTIVNNGEQQNLTCKWLIGADGAHSFVRKQLQIPFTGDMYQHKFYLADITFKSTLGDYLNMYLSPEGFAAFFPMPEANSYRIVGNLPDEFDTKEGLTFEDIKPYLNKTSGLDLQVEECHWFTAYHLHHRMAERFRDNRCFLIGDAAHIHSPIGGQGMNTGLQDAYNLGWKLAGVVKGHLNARILNSYPIERMPVAKQLLKTTDRAFNFIMSHNLFARGLKRWVLPSVLKFTWSSHKFKQQFFTQISQLGISYRESQINLNLSQADAIKAGDRLPYIKVYDEKKQQETDLHDWCTKPGFTLIVMGKFQEADLFALAKWITQKYTGQLNFFYLPHSKRNTAVFKAFEVGENQKKALIIRPDMYIGYINDAVDIDMMDNYLSTIAGLVTV